MTASNSFLQSPFQTLIDQKPQPLPGSDPVREVAPPDLSAASAPAAPAPRAVAPAALVPPAEMRPLFEATAAHFKVPVNVLMALAQQESSYRTDAVNPASGAAGIGGYMDATAKSLGINARDPNEAIPAAAMQLRERLDKGYSIEDAVKEHFAGPDRKLWGDKTKAYGAEVMAKAVQIGQQLYGGEDDAPAAPAAGPEQNQFAPDRMARADYEKEFRALNPKASAGAVAAAMAQYDQQAETRRQAAEAQRKDSPVKGIPTPEEFFDQRLNAKLQGKQGGVVPQLPGRQQKAAFPETSTVHERDRPGIVDQAVGDFGRGIDNLRALGYGSAGMAAEAAGKSDEATRLLDQYVAIQNDIAKNNPATIGSFKNIHGMGDVGRYAVEAVMENLPMILPSLLTGGVGAQAAKVGAQRLVGGMIEAQVAKGIAREVAEKNAAQFIARRVMMGSAAGAAPATIGMETGSIGGDIYQETGQKRPGLALAGGVPAGLLDTLEPVLALRKIAGPVVDEVVGGIVKRLGVEAGKQFLAEAGTEGVQTIIEEAAKAKAANRDLLTPQLLDNVIDAALKGGIGGAGMGLASQGVGEARAALAQPGAAPAQQPRVEPTLGPAPAPQETQQDQQVAGASAPNPADPVPAFQADDEGFTGQILGDDGQMHTVDSRTGVSGPLLGAVEAAAAQGAGPMSAAIEQAAAQHAVNPAPLPAMPQAEPAAPDYNAMPLDELKAALKDVAQRAQQNPEQRKALAPQRKQIEQAINARGKQALADSKPAAEPLSAGPFDDMGAANKMMARYAKETGQPHEVVAQGEKFEVKPIGEVGNGIDTAGAGRGSDGHRRSSDAAGGLGRADAQAGRPAEPGTVEGAGGRGVGTDGRRDGSPVADGAAADGAANHADAVDPVAELAKKLQPQADRLTNMRNEAVRKFNAAKEVGNVKAMESLKTQIDGFDAKRRQITHQLFLEGQKVAAKQRAAENGKTYGAMDVGTKIGMIGYESHDDTYFQKVGPNKWQRTMGGATSDHFKTDAQMEGKRVIASKENADVPERQEVPEEAPLARGAQGENPAAAGIRPTTDAGTGSAPAAPDVAPQPAAGAPAPTKPAAPAKPSAGDRMRSRVQSENPFLAFLSQHGIHTDERSDTGGERTKAVMVPGYGSLYRKAGLRLDELTALAHEAGFLSDQDVNDPSDTGGTRKMADLIERAAHRKEVIQPASASEPAAPDADQELLAEAEKLGLNTAGKTADQVYDEVVAAHAARFADDEAALAVDMAQDADIPLDGGMPFDELTDEDIDAIFGIQAANDTAGSGRETEGDPAEAPAGRAGEAGAAQEGGDEAVAERKDDPYTRDLFGGQDLFDDIEVRPGTLPAQKSAARAAISDLARRLGIDRINRRAHPGGEQVSVLGSRLLKNFIAGKPNQLVGQEAKTPADLAVLAQVYRDPRFETFRVFYTDRAGRIVGEAGYTSRMAASVTMPTDLLQQIHDDKQRFKAAGYYLLHNHPSGKSEPSRADIKLTRFVDQHLPGFQGHVVIDHNEYSVIHNWGEETIQAPHLNGQDFTAIPEMEHAMLGVKLSSPDAVARAAKALQVPNGHATLILTTADGKTQLLVDVPMALLNKAKSGDDFTRIKALVRRMTRETGAGGNRFMVLPAGANVRDVPFLRMLGHGVVTDVVSADGSSLRELGGPYAGDFMDKGRRKSQRVAEPVERGEDRRAASRGTEDRRTIEVDGVRRPIRDASGRLIGGGDFMKQLEFWRDYKSELDEGGRPILDASDTRAVEEEREAYSVEAPVTPYTAQPQGQAPAGGTQGQLFPQAGAGLLPPPPGLLRRIQGQLQDNLNRLKQVQERISKITGVKDFGRGDYYLAEQNRPGRIAARKEDGRDKLIEPLMQKLAAIGRTPDQLSELLHAMHAEERNDSIAQRNQAMPDGGSGMKTKDAKAILARYQNDTELHALADDARAIARATLDMKLAYGLITPDDYQALTKAYQHYVPLKGDGDDGTPGSKGKGTGPQMKRATGHGERDEFILENIARDFEQAIVVGEKNLARQSLLQMVLQYPDADLWTARVPPKGKTVVGNAYDIMLGNKKVASFSSKSQVSAFLEAKGAQAASYTVQASNGERVVEFTKPLQDYEVMVYVKGDPVRIQIYDEALARQLRPLHSEMMNTVLQLMQKHNRILSAIYTGYNPAFILKNAARDAITGSINMTGNHGAATAAKAWTKYPAAWLAMLNWARTKQDQGGKMGAYLKEYREQGGKVGASYMSDLEQQGKSLQRMFDDAKGAMAYAREGRVGKAAWIATRKAIGAMAHAVEVANQAFENALRLALYAQLREEGHKPGIAAAAAKNVTVNFDRKGTATPYLGAFYLFINPAIQGTANMSKTLTKGRHKGQAWALAGMMAGAGFAAAIHGMDDDKDRWLGEKWDTRTKNLRYRVGGYTVNIPLSQEYAPFYALGVAMGEVARGQSSLRASANVLSSFLDAYYPMQGAFQPGSDNYGMDLLLAHIPTVGKMPAQIAANRNSFGNKVVPETDNTKNRADNLKMQRGTKNSVFDSAAQGIASAGEALGADKYGNDLSKISPETLKLIYSTYTGGLGRFVTDTIGAGVMAAQDHDQIEVGDVPVVKDFVKADSMQAFRTRYFDLADQAQESIDQFALAIKQRDMTEAQAIAGDPARRAMLGLAGMIKATNKVEGIYADQAVAINADKTLAPAEKRARLKELEDKQEEIYRKAIKAFR